MQEWFAGMPMQDAGRLEHADAFAIDANVMLATP
jgi:hypothetical protein